jgi:hypothetical protein
MQLELVPLLEVQRDLYRMPRGMERFRAYLRTLIDERTGDIALPIVTMNPMGKEHVLELLDELIRLDAEGAARRALESAASSLASEPGEYRIGIVVADDRMGSWTNRATTELSHRFESGPMLRRGWLVALLWTSEAPSAERAREEVLLSAYRAAYIGRNGPATTLGDMLKQEGYCMAAAGCERPTLEAEDLAYTREVVGPCLEARDQPTIVACLFGDEAARSLGYPPLGLSERAGFALALADAVY